MPDLKISEMPPPNEVANGDLIPIVSGGANYAATRADVLTGITGEDITLQASFGQAEYVKSTNGNGFFIAHTTGDVEMTSDSQVTLQSPSGNDFWAVSNGSGIGGSFTNGTRFNVSSNNALAEFSLSDVPGGSFIRAPGGLSTSYDDGNSPDWAVSMPSDANVAIERLRSAVRALLGTPIP
jgi:hypothetical protein